MSRWWRPRGDGPAADGHGPGDQAGTDRWKEATVGARDGDGDSGSPSPASEAAGVSVSGTGPATATAPNALANSGHIDKLSVGTLNVPRPVREPAPWPHMVGTIPARAQSFQHRAESDTLREAVTDGGTAVLCQVLSGLGGVGKTQLAAEYARTAWAAGEPDVLVWITASSRPDLLAGYAQAGTELCRADPNDIEKAAAAFLAWLAPTPGRACRWLVVLDDVADPDDLRGLWPPDSPSGRTLLTTRRRDAALGGTGRHRIDVGLFTPAEALAYLTSALAAHHRTEPDDQLHALADDLGRLPLALAQAAAYLTDAEVSCAEYRALLADQTATLTHAAPDRLPDDQSIAVAAAWSLSIDRADTLRPVGLARPMLHLAAFLSPNGIPETVLTGLPARAHLTTHRTGRETADTDTDTGHTTRDTGRLTAHQARPEADGTRPDTAHAGQGADHTGPDTDRAGRGTDRDTDRDTDRPDPDAVHTAPDTTDTAQPVSERDARLTLRALHRLSLIDHTGETPDRAVRVHQLVQRATRDTLTPDRHQRVARTAADALIEAWPYPEHPEAARILRANSDALTACAEHALYRPDAHWLLFRHGRSLNDSGQTTSAIAYHEHLAATTSRHLGTNHPHTLSSRNNLAHAYQAAGDLNRAIPLYQQTLTDCLRVLGADHPDTLATRSNLAYAYQAAGDLNRAIPLYQQTLTDCLRVLGEDDPHTLSTRNNLAYAYQAGGDLSRAIVLHQQNLTHRTRVLGGDHPDILTERCNLASAYQAAGDLGRAIPMHQQTLTVRIRVLGEDHPDTLTSRNNLAHAYQDAGDLDRAIPLYERTLTDQTRVLGEDHPHTLNSRSNLATAYQAAGHLDRAIPLYERTLTDQTRVLGEDHPSTLLSCNNLAHAYQATGHLDRAIPLYQQNLTDCLRVLGADHPYTLTIGNNLAGAYFEAGDLSQAIALHERTLSDRTRVLGADHPDTLASRNNLASAYHATGHLDRAIPLFWRAFAAAVRVLGEDHPITATVGDNLAAAVAARDGGGQPS